MTKMMLIAIAVWAAFLVLVVEMAEASVPTTIWEPIKISKSLEVIRQHINKHDGLETVGLSQEMEDWHKEGFRVREISFRFFKNIKPLPYQIHVVLIQASGQRQVMIYRANAEVIHQILNR